MCSIIPVVRIKSPTHYLFSSLLFHDVGRLEGELVGERVKGES